MAVKSLHVCNWAPLYSVQAAIAYMLSLSHFTGNGPQWQHKSEYQAVNCADEASRHPISFPSRYVARLQILICSNDGSVSRCASVAGVFPSSRATNHLSFFREAVTFVFMASACLCILVLRVILPPPSPNGFHCIESHRNANLFASRPSSFISLFLSLSHPGSFNKIQLESNKSRMQQEQQPLIQLKSVRLTLASLQRSQSWLVYPLPMAAIAVYGACKGSLPDRQCQLH